MQAAKIGLVVMLLAAVASEAQAQMLPRRRVGAALGNHLAELGTLVTFDALSQGLNKAFDELGEVVALQLALQLYAQIERDSAAKERFTSGARQDSTHASYIRSLLDKSARLAQRLKDEDDEFSPPVLEAIYLDHQQIDSTKAAGKGTPWTPRQIYLSGNSKKGDSPKDANRPSVTFAERHQPKEPRTKLPPNVHCLLVFLTTKEGQPFRKTIAFDFAREQSKAGSSSAVWKIKNVQYDQPVPMLEGGFDSGKSTLAK